ncbi:MAG TPA: hypothetical protein VNP72_07385, partial [Longimicrobium sp.]|nr:hypothetical protein [Longimicrobium sp.]
TGQAAKLRAINEDVIRQSVPNLFKTQLGDPVRGFVTRMKVKLQPFADAVTAIQDFVKTTLVELPARVDRLVGAVLDKLKADLKTVLGEVIATINTLRDAITRTITRVYEQVKEQVEKVNPAWVLNSFVEADLAEGGIAAMATAIAAAADQPSALLQSRLASDQLALVQSKRGDYGAAVIGALNGVLRDADFASRLGTAAKTRVDADQKALAETLKTAQGDAWLTARRAQIRGFALARQLDAAQKAFAVPATRKAGLIRLNRVILEVHFPAHLKAGLQGLHPYVVETVAHLWPEETVARVDKLYADILADIRTLPDRLIRAPLDEAYAKVKAKLKETFDIQGIFRVVDLKIDGIEGDLSKGLDRLSVAYERLLTTLDQRLAA